MALLKVTNEAFPYLVLQRGKLWSDRHDREEWEANYFLDLADDFKSFQDFLPFQCESILDIGGGIGGIDVLLSSYYNLAPEIAILDSIKSDAHVVSHSIPFNDAAITRQFLSANGVEKFTPIDHLDLPKPRPFDLIISLASWCFHYPPNTYLQWVKACIRDGSVIVVDVRKNRSEWVSQLNKAFSSIPFLVLPRPKMDRLVYIARI